MTARMAGADGFPEVPPGDGPDTAGVGSGEDSDVAGVASGSGSAAAGGARLVVCAPLLPEAWAVRPGIGEGGEVRVSGYGAGRARRQGERLRQVTFGALVVAGTGGGLTDDLRPGDLVVASEVTDGTTTTACPSAPLLAGGVGPGRLPGLAGPVGCGGRL